MKFWKKTLPFLLLNIIVSAATVFGVLWLWQQRGGQLDFRPTSTPAVTLASQSTKQIESTPLPTLIATNSDSGLLSIEGVFGAGDLNVEYVLIRNQSDTSVNLNGWSLSASSGEKYKLPYLVLNKNGAVRVYSKYGVDSVIELYWNSDQALWNSGDQVYLVDQSGKQQASWQVP